MDRSENTRPGLANKSVAKARRLRRLAQAIERAELAPGADLVELAVQLSQDLPAGAIAILIPRHGVVAIARSWSELEALGGVEPA